MGVDFGFVIALSAYAIGLVVGTVAHKAAHCGTAWLLDCGPRLVSIGRGPIMVRCRIGQVWLVVRAIPMTGYSARLPSPRTRRASIACVVAAGPAATILLLGVSAAALVASISALADNPTAVAMGLFVAQAVIGLSSLSPRVTRYRKGARPNATDGLKLIRFLRGSDPDEFATLYTAVLPASVRPGSPPIPSLAAREMLYQLTRRDLRADDWAQADAAKVITRLLNEGGLTEVEHRFLVDWLELRQPLVPAGAPTD